MPVEKEQFDYLEELVGRAEDLVRYKNPKFISGFHVINMQAHRVEGTIYRLRDIKTNLKDSEQILLDNIAKLCSANPDQKPKGTAYARRMLRNKPLWQKVVSAHNLDSSDVLDSVKKEPEEESELAKVLKKMSPKDAKVEFERHDYTLRYKLQGIEKLTETVTYYISILTPRLKRLEHLEEIGKKWTCRIFELEDIEKIEKAQQIVVDSSSEVKEAISVINTFPEDFTKFCELEDVGRGLKRKVDWESEGATPEKTTGKRVCMRGTRSGAARHTL